MQTKIDLNLLSFPSHQGFVRSYKVLQGLTISYKVLKGLTRSCKVFQGLPRSEHLSLGVSSCYVDQKKTEISLKCCDL